jgi:hypothetical protein
MPGYQSIRKEIMIFKRGPIAIVPILQKRGLDIARRARPLQHRAGCPAILEYRDDTLHTCVDPHRYAPLLQADAPTARQLLNA